MLIKGSSVAGLRSGMEFFIYSEANGHQDQANAAGLRRLTAVEPAKPSGVGGVFQLKGWMI